MYTNGVLNCESNTRLGRIFVAPHCKRGSDGIVHSYRQTNPEFWPLLLQQIVWRDETYSISINQRFILPTRQVAPVEPAWTRATTALGMAAEWEAVVVVARVWWAADGINFWPGEFFLPFRCSWSFSFVGSVTWQCMSRSAPRGGREEKHFHSAYDSAEYLYFSGIEES